ncbi:peptidase M16 inactive domain protein, partial [Chlamydia psittaci 03DC29]
YAVSMACMDKSITATMSYLASGLPYVDKIRDLTNNFDKEIDNVVGILQSLYKKCFFGKRQLVLSGSKANYQHLYENNFYGILDVEGQSCEPWVNPSIDMVLGSQGLYIPARAAFNALAFPIGDLPYDHPDAAALTVAAEILDNTVLHTKIREQGGAYGSGAAVNLGRGAFYCYSYRDPEIFDSHQAFLYGIEEVAKGNFSNDDIHEGVLGVIQNLDAPIAPGTRASTGYYRLRCGRIPALRQAFRRAVLAVTKEHICSVMKKYLQDHKDKATFISFAGKDMLQDNASRFDQELSIKSAL